MTPKPLLVKRPTLPGIQTQTCASSAGSQLLLVDAVFHCFLRDRGIVNTVLETNTLKILLQDAKSSVGYLLPSFHRKDTRVTQVLSSHLRLPVSRPRRTSGSAEVLGSQQPSGAASLVLPTGSVKGDAPKKIEHENDTVASPGGPECPSRAWRATC